MQKLFTFFLSFVNCIVALAQKFSTPSSVKTTGRIKNTKTVFKTILFKYSIHHYFRL